MGTFLEDFQAAGSPTWALVKGMRFATDGINAGSTLVVYNSNSSLSYSIAQYYMGLRAIASANLCAVDVSTTANFIEKADFWADVRDVINSHIAANGLRIRCVVMMPDIPLGVNLETDPQEDPIHRALDSVLSALPDATGAVYGNFYKYFCGTGPKPFSNKMQRWCAPMVLVSRIDGPGEDNEAREAAIKSMLDSAIAGEALRDGGTPMPGTFYFDRQPDMQYPPLGGYYWTYDQYIQDAADYANSQSKTYHVENTDARLTTFDYGSASFYSGWYGRGFDTSLFPDDDLPTWGNWTDGALAVETHSAGCESLKYIVVPNTPFRSACAYLVSQGVAGTFGPLGEPGLDAFPKPDLLLQRVFSGLTWGEAYWSVVPDRGRGMMILVGDPLYRPFPRATP